MKGPFGCFRAQGLQKAAVYRDKDGKLHMCSAICTHMGAQVRGRSWRLRCRPHRMQAPAFWILNSRIRPLLRSKVCPV